jgi:hypothetical protein
MGICLIIRTDINNVTFHDEDRDIFVYPFQGLGLVNNTGMPASAGEG